MEVLVGAHFGQTMPGQPRRHVLFCSWQSETRARPELGTVAMSVLPSTVARRKDSMCYRSCPKAQALHVAPPQITSLYLPLFSSSTKWDPKPPSTLNCSAHSTPGITVH